MNTYEKIEHFGVNPLFQILKKSHERGRMGSIHTPISPYARIYPQNVDHANNTSWEKRSGKMYPLKNPLSPIKWAGIMDNFVATIFRSLQGWLENIQRFLL